MRTDNTISSGTEAHLERAWRHARAVAEDALAAHATRRITITLGEPHPELGWAHLTAEPGPRN